MAKLESKDIDLKKFKNEIEIVMLHLENLRMEAEQAEEFAVEGRIPLYGVPSWELVVERAGSLTNFFKKSWPKIKDAAATKGT